MAESLRLSVQMVILSEVRRVKIIHWGKKIDVSVPYGTLGARGTKSRVSTFCALTPRARRGAPTSIFFSLLCFDSHDGLRLRGRTVDIINLELD